MELIDIGCNLTHDSFDDDLDEVVAQARAAGVAQFIVTGASNEGMQQASEMARERPGVFYSTAGIHPHHADTFDDETETAPCPQCGAEIYEDAVACPVCGSYVTPGTSAWAGRPAWWIVLGVLGTVAAVLVLTRLLTW